MEKKLNINAREFRKVVWLHFKQTKLIKYFILLIFFLAIIHFSMEDGNPVVGVIFPTLIFGAVVAFVFWSAYTRVFRENKEAFASSQIFIVPEYFGLKSKDATVELKWKAVQKVLKTGDYLFFYTRKNSFTPLKIADFTEAELAELKIILNSNGVKHNLS